MRIPLTLALLSSIGLAAQTPADTPAPAGPAVKWRGALWASAAASDRPTADGSLFLRPVDAGDGQLALDGLQVGADVALGDGWGMKFTLLGGQAGKVLNAATLGPGGRPAETGSLAWPEAMLTWTGGDDTFKVGRMYTAMGMEVMDGTQDLTASRGLLFTFAIPFAQVGLDWHHAFSTAWSTDVWLYNGEDRVQDNNKGKSAGLGLTYNHAGAADKFCTLMAFSGPEQDGWGSGHQAGAEGRKRNRLSLAGQWVWGASTLVWEGDYAREAFPGAAVGGLGTTTVDWSALGLIYKYQFTERWGLFARAERLHDGSGVRLTADTTIADPASGLFLPNTNADLVATSAALGAERRWHATFTRFEARWDNLDHAVPERDGTPFKSAVSLTWSVGTSF